MNWFTTFHYNSSSLEKKTELVNEHGGCDHVVADPSLLVSVSFENDSFGREGYCVCEECRQKQQEEEGAEIVCCHDCGQKFPKKETIAWKWYDFYAPQGDEPMIICNGCRTKEQHRERVQSDRQEQQAEEEYYGRYS